MSNVFLPHRQNVHSPQGMPDHEKELVARLSMMNAISSSVPCPAEITNFYVALKTKPLVLLAGPRGAGKIALVERLSHILKLGNGSDRSGNFNFQNLLGHPWWVGTSQNLPVFTDAHQRFNTDKLLFMLNEARREVNAQRLFITCLSRISPAELKNIFSDLSQQISLGKLNRIGDLHLEKPVTYPFNLRFVGTMDTDNYEWWDEDLLSQALIIPWKENKPFKPGFDNMNTINGESVFLQSIVKGRNEIYQKIYRILMNLNQPLKPLLELEDLIIQYKVKETEFIIEDSLSFLANSWSIRGEGLFSSSVSKNLDISLDFAISQIVLPRVNEVIKNEVSSRKKLMNILSPSYPRSACYLNSIPDADFATRQIAFN